MRFGFRTPSFKKRFAARTSWKRLIRHSIGLKAPRGFGWFTNPRKALYNRIYNRTTFDIFKLLARGPSRGRKATSNSSSPFLTSVLKAVLPLLLIAIPIGFLISALSNSQRLSSKQSRSSTIPTPTPHPQTITKEPQAIADEVKITSPATPAFESEKGAVTSKQPMQTGFRTALEAQQSAVRLYPDLGIAGSSLNTAFVARYNFYKKQHPAFFNDNSWPLRLAEEVVHSGVPR